MLFLFEISAVAGGWPGFRHNVCHSRGQQQASRPRAVRSQDCWRRRCPGSEKRRGN